MWSKIAEWLVAWAVFTAFFSGVTLLVVCGVMFAFWTWVDDPSLWFGVLRWSVVGGFVFSLIFVKEQHFGK